MDIKNKIEKEFGGEYLKALVLLEQFEKQNELSSRVSECIIYLSKGSIEKLKYYIELAEVDWRDVIDIAENG